MSQKRLHLIVRGRVQGVFFRASAQREARRLGLTGWAQNRRDSSVEVVVEGPEDELREFLGFCNRGPSAARVDKVDVRWRGYTGEFPEFRIVND